MNMIFTLYETMQSQNLLLAYHGNFTQEMTRSILTITEKKLKAAGEEPATRRRVFNVMMELLQNIVKHSEQIGTDESDRNAIFLVGSQPTHYSIMSGNLVLKTHVPQLRDTLEEINGLDKEGLRDLYKKNIQQTRLSEKGGAGLGFMHMARKSGDKLWFDFQEVSQSCAFFCLKVNVSRPLND